MNYFTSVCLLLLCMNFLTQKTFAYIYEECSWINHNYTERLFENGEIFQNKIEAEINNFCDEICLENQIRADFLSYSWWEHNSHKFNTVIHNNKNTIHPLCFYISMIRSAYWKEDKFYYCYSSQDSKSLDYMSFSCQETLDSCKLSNNPLEVNTTENRRRHCLNENYIQLTARSFNTMTDCFGFSKAEKKQLFALFNHESSFLVNARSKYEAKCYGQLIKSKFQDINKYIYFRETNKWENYSQIYKDVVNKCPTLVHKIIPKDILEDKTPNLLKLQEFNNKANFTCGVTHDIHSCLFYSLYAMKINFVGFNKIYYLEENEDFTIPIPQQLKDDFQLPIQLNEVITVKGKVTSKITGKTIAGEWIVTSHEDLYNLFYENYSYDINNLKIEKINLFSYKTLKYHFTQTAHNAGISLIDNVFMHFMKHTKGKITNNKLCIKEDTNAQHIDMDCMNYRTLLLNSQSLTNYDLEKVFGMFWPPID